MSILIVHGPHTTYGTLTHELLQQLQQQAHAAGRALEWCTCGDLRDMVVQVSAVKPLAIEFVLLDLGDLAPQAQAHPEAGLTGALDKLGAPYIEVHEKFGEALERGVGSHHAPVATIAINGNLGSSYRIGLGIALRQLKAKTISTPALAG